MKLCKPILHFISPNINSVIEDQSYEYFDDKPIVKQVRYPGIKTDDGTVIVKSTLQIKKLTSSNS